MVLSHSRQIFLRFFLDARMENFLRGHVAAFTAWQGVPRVLLYDNLKSAVLERRGDAIRFHPTLLCFAGHYRYERRPVAVARGNETDEIEQSLLRDPVLFSVCPWVIAGHRAGHEVQALPRSHHSRASFAAPLGTRLPRLVQPSVRRRYATSPCSARRRSSSRSRARLYS